MDYLIIDTDIFTSLFKRSVFGQQYLPHLVTSNFHSRTWFWDCDRRHDRFHHHPPMSILACEGHEYQTRPRLRNLHRGRSHQVLKTPHIILGDVWRFVLPQYRLYSAAWLYSQMKTLRRGYPPPGDAGAGGALGAFAGICVG